MNSERRAYNRYYFAKELQGTIQICKLNTVPFFTTEEPIFIKDMSATGIRFSIHERLPINDTITYQILFEIEKEPFLFEGKIVRKAKDEKGTYEYGFHFNGEQNFNLASYLLEKVTQEKTIQLDLEPTFKQEE